MERIIRFAAFNILLNPSKICCVGSVQTLLIRSHVSLFSICLYSNFALYKIISCFNLVLSLFLPDKSIRFVIEGIIFLYIIERAINPNGK